MAPFKFFYDLLSPPSRALYIFFKFNKIEHEAISVALRKGEHLSESYKNDISRFNKVPVIHHDGLKLTESLAIFHYLSRQGIIPEYWNPADVKQRAMIDEYNEWEHNNIRLTAALFFRAQWVEPILTGKPANPKVLDQRKEDYFKSLDILENIWLKDTKFVAGNEITIADLFGACDVMQPHVCASGPDITRHKKVIAWLASVKRHFGASFDDGHKHIYAYNEKFGGNPPL